MFPENEWFLVTCLKTDFENFKCHFHFFVYNKCIFFFKQKQECFQLFYVTRVKHQLLFSSFQTFLIFLLLCLQQDVQRYKLGNPRTFHYLNQTNCFELDGVDDSKEYIATRRAMEVVGISTDEQVFHRELVQVEDKILQL